MDHYNVPEGVTMVLEDDFVIRELDKMVQAIALVPLDWDVIRFDCWQEPLAPDLWIPLKWRHP